MQQLFDLFVAPPGSLIYYLVLAISLTAALQATLISRQGTDKALMRRLMTGLFLILAGQVVLFVVSGLAWQGFANPHYILAPLDRAVTAFSLLWIAWLWLFPRPNRVADAITAALSLVIAIGGGFSLNNWVLFPPDLGFNGTQLDQIWEVASLAIIVLGMLLLFIRRPDGWGMGLSMLALNLAGHLYHFLGPVTVGDFAGVVRLAIVCSFPMLPILAQRNLYAAALAYTPSLQAQVAPEVSKPLPSKVAEWERRHYTASPRTVFDWLQLALIAQPDQLYSEFIRAFAQTMVADLCLLVRPPDANGKIVVLSCYDLIHEEFLQAAAIDRDLIPNVAVALQKGRALRLNKDEAVSPDVAALGKSLGLADPGSLMLVPLTNPSRTWGGVILLSPYSSRTWSAEDQTYLLSSIETIVQILSKGEKTAGQALTNPAAQVVPAAQPEFRRIQEDLSEAHRLLVEMKGENRLLLEEIAVLRSSNPIGDLESLLAVQKESQQMVTSLQEENERLQVVLARRENETLPDFLPVDSEPGVSMEPHADRYAEEQVRAALSQVARLENALAHSNAQILLLQQNHPKAGTSLTEDEDHEVINALVQEFRQPMASISGYTDLLLAESAGIIGALQRNFLERVKGSVERMQAICNDLLQITHLQSHPLELTPEPINASVLIDEAMNAVRSQVRAKNITLRVDLPDELPEIKADRDALQQIVVHLLQNASAATPVEGAISLRVRLQPGDRDVPSMLLQVTDTGGGIAADDLPRVFSRRYRADNALIQGVGDGGVGLSIAKTLVEAHQGRIWVDSVPGQSSTFSVLLPLNPSNGVS